MIFYPRSPGGERPNFRRRDYYPLLFSIHAPREGSGFEGNGIVNLFSTVFYPRSPGGERLSVKYFYFRLREVFYPRSPGGERREFLQIRFQ